MGTGLPKRVEEQGKRAEELIKKLQAGQDPSAVQPAANTPAAPANPDPPANAPVNPPAATPAPPAAPEPPANAPAPATPSPAPSCPECAKWAQKFSVLQGKYDAEVPRYAYRVQYLENQLTDLNGQIVALRSSQVAPSATPSTPATPPAAVTSISEAMKDNEEFKAFKANFPDIAEMVGKMVDTAATKIHQDTVLKLTALESNSVQDRKTKFNAALDAKHPGWQMMGQDPNWATWLSQKDRYSPRKRIDLLKEANQALDTEAIINLLDDFKADMAKAGITPSAFPPSTPAPSAPAVPFVTPPSGPGSTPASPNSNQGPESVTRSYIRQFYEDKTRGRYKGREEEVVKIQAKIDAAMQAGRVLNK